MTNKQVSETELASYRFKLQRIQGEELVLLLETLLKQGRLTEALAPDISTAIERGAGSRLTPELLSKVVAATRSKRIFEAGREILNQGRGEWYRFVGLIDDEDVEQQLVQLLYDVSMTQGQPYFSSILDALVERGSHSGLEVMRVLLYEFEPKLQLSNVVFEGVKNKISGDGTPIELGSIIANRRILEMYVEPLRDGIAKLQARLDSEGIKEPVVDQKRVVAQTVGDQRDHNGNSNLWRDPPKPENVRSIIKNGEGPDLEFKSTLRKSLPPKQDTPNYVIEAEVVKTVCGFLNTNGGVLFIGVKDSGEYLGIGAPDDFLNLDLFQRHFSNLMRNSIGAGFYASYVSAHVITIDDKNLYYVKCQRSESAVYALVKMKQDAPEVKAFFTRVGSETAKLEGGELVMYCQTRFPRTLT